MRTGDAGGFGRRAALRLGAGLGAALALGPRGLRADEDEAAPDPGVVAIGAGDPQGVYYAIGQALCRVLSRDDDPAGPLRCEAPATAGSIENIEGLRAGRFQFALAQADWQREAWLGAGRFDQRRFERLRSVMSLHTEVFTVIAADVTRAQVLGDLRGMRVDVGAAGSGRRATLGAAMASRGWSLANFSEITQLDAASRAAALARGRIDAIVDMVGHPNAGTRAAMKAADARLLPAEGDWVRRLIADDPGFGPAEIPGKLYRGAPEPTPSFGLRATLLVSADLDGAVVRRVARAVFENFDRFHRLHPALAGLSEATMVRDGLHAPLHPGAEAYYRERGWL
ncbi:MAG: TAXI family TRAP transporter solute-binding subunit [Pseudomonadota bacterium]|nr:TAXI family TRAP transporter solute-binding subunit [Pseudomonadota bacterium]